MKVILLQKVPGVGNADEVKEVADGYARNFLFPKHLAIQASPKLIKDLGAQQAKKAQQVERDLQSEQAIAGRIDGLEIELFEKASDKGMLYAAAGAQKIIDGLKKMGFTISKDQVIMKPIKSLGNYSVKIKFKHGLEAEVKVAVSEAR